jgi:hypothetical protein
MRVILCLSTILSVMLCVIESSTAGQNKGLVGNLKNPDLIMGCQCYSVFGKPSRNPSGEIFVSSAGDRETWMNIDGIDTRLQFVSETKSKGEVRVGSRYTERYAAGDITVEILFIVTSVKRDGYGETTRFSATFKVRKGSRLQVVKGSGLCGC